MPGSLEPGGSLPGDLDADIAIATFTPRCAAILAARLARELADLITGTDSEITRLPWVSHRSPHWEPEPLRWLGVNAGLRAMSLADLQEARTGRPSRG